MVVIGEADAALRRFSTGHVELVDGRAKGIERRAILLIQPRHHEIIMPQRLGIIQRATPVVTQRVEADMSRRRAQAQAVELLAKIRRLAVVVPRKLHLLVADPGHLRHGAVKILREQRAHGVELDSDVAELVAGCEAAAGRKRRGQRECQSAGASRRNEFPAVTVHGDSASPRRDPRPGP